MKWKEYVEVIKEIARKFLEEKIVKPCVFGSTIKGNFGSLSDIDVAVVLMEDEDEWGRARFKAEVVRKM